MVPVMAYKHKGTKIQRDHMELDCTCKLVYTLALTQDESNWPCPCLSTMKYFEPQNRFDPETETTLGHQVPFNQLHRGYMKSFDQSRMSVDFEIFRVDFVEIYVYLKNLRCIFPQRVWKCPVLRAHLISKLTLVMLMPSPGPTGPAPRLEAIACNSGWLSRWTTGLKCRHVCFI